MKSNVQAVEMRHNRSYEEPKHICFIDLNLSFLEEEIIYAVNWWNSGRNMVEVAEKLKRDPDEIGCLVMELSRKGMIKPRKGAFEGRG